MLRYWFSGISAITLVMAVVLGIMGGIDEFRSGHRHLVTWINYGSAICFLLASVVTMSLRRYAVVRFKWVFKCWPSLDENWAISLGRVENVIRRRAMELREAYYRKDDARG